MFTLKQKRQIKNTIAKFPKRVQVSVTSSTDGGFYAEIRIKDDILRTQAETLPELIEMVNDAIYTYFEIPANKVRYMPTYIPPTSVAQKFGLYPIQWHRIPTVPMNI